MDHPERHDATSFSLFPPVLLFGPPPLAAGQSLVVGSPRSTFSTTPTRYTSSTRSLTPTSGFIPPSFALLVKRSTWFSSLDHLVSLFSACGLVFVPLLQNAAVSLEVPVACSALEVRLAQ